MKRILKKVYSPPSRPSITSDFPPPLPHFNDNIDIPCSDRGDLNACFENQSYPTQESENATEEKAWLKAEKEKQKLGVIMMRFSIFRLISNCLTSCGSDY